MTPFAAGLIDDLLKPFAADDAPAPVLGGLLATSTTVSSVFRLPLTPYRLHNWRLASNGKLSWIM